MPEPTVFIDRTQSHIDGLRANGYTESADDLERWRHLAQHLCYRLGHGPSVHALDPTRCGRCEHRYGGPDA